MTRPLSILTEWIDKGSMKRIDWKRHIHSHRVFQRIQKLFHSFLHFMTVKIDQSALWVVTLRHLVGSYNASDERLDFFTQNMEAVLSSDHAAHNLEDRYRLNYRCDLDRLLNKTNSHLLPISAVNGLGNW